MAVPSSERATYRWLCQRSALGELLQVDFETMSMMQLYRAADALVRHQQQIEGHLFTQVTELFGLQTTVTLVVVVIHDQAEIRFEFERRLQLRRCKVENPGSAIGQNAKGIYQLMGTMSIGDFGARPDKVTKLGAVFISHILIFALGKGVQRKSGGKQSHSSFEVAVQYQATLEPSLRVDGFTVLNRINETEESPYAQPSLVQGCCPPREDSWSLANPPVAMV